MSEQAPITGSFIWTLDDAKISQDIFAGRPVTMQEKVFAYAFLGILIAALLAFLSITGKINFRSFFSNPSQIVFPLVIFTIFFLFFIYRYSANLKKGFLQSPASNKRVEITITREEIIAKVEGISESKWNWNTIKEVRRHPLGFSFFQTEQAGLWIPIRTFASPTDIDSMAQLAKQLAQEKPSLKYKEFI